MAPAFAQTTVTAVWDRNLDSMTAGYRVYYGTTSGTYQWSVDAGNQTSAPLTLSPGQVYYVAVRAYNASYQYGPASNEATINLGAPAPAPPGPTAPTAQISATLQSANTALVSWQTTNAASANINGTPVAASGSTTVTVQTTTTFTLTAVSSSGVTATHSATVTVAATTMPGTPTALAAAVSGARATLSWRAPASGTPPDGYLLYVGTKSGTANMVNGMAVGNVLRIAGDLPRGTYFARVRAVNRAGAGGFSNEVRFRIGRTLRTPSGFNVQWQGTTAVLSWTAPAADVAEDVATSYVLEAGSAPGLSDVATVTVGNTTTFRVEVPLGTYYVRVRAVNAYGDSEPTNELTVVAPGAPGQPRALKASGSGPAVTLNWAPPADGVGIHGYLIEVGSAPGRSDLAALAVGQVTTFSTVAPPGVYYVRVRAANARGAGAPSNEIIVRR